MTSCPQATPPSDKAPDGGTPPVRAVIFDVGGVLTTSPVAAIRAYAEASGVDYARLQPLLASPTGTWSRFEMSALTPEEFAALFQAECLEQGLTLESAAFLASFTDLPLREEMLAIVRYLHGRYKLGCITNNVRRERFTPGMLHDLFDVVIESAKVGVRKPDPAIYHLACEQLGVRPEEAVFLDDFGVNVKGARALGMTTIKVDETHRAIDELEAALGITLPRPDGAAGEIGDADGQQGRDR